MKKFVILLVIVLLVLILIPLVFSGDDEPNTDTDGEGEVVTLSGEVIDVNLEQIAVDGPGLVTIIDSSDTERVIAIPSMGIMLCPSNESIAGFDDIEVGDRVEVRGAEGPEGQVVPCEDEDDYLYVIKMYSDNELGFEFEYKAGISGYVLEDDLTNLSTDTNFVQGIMLTDWHEYEALQESTDAREGPPTIQVKVYENPDQLSPFVWVDRNPTESNVELALGEVEEDVVAGANAAHYLVDGLYAMDTYVVAHDSRIFILLGMYLDENTEIVQDFEDLLETFEFTQTPEQE